MFAKFFNRKKRSVVKRKRVTSSTHYQKLESRELLASVTLVGDQLSVVGDYGLHDEITVKQIGSDIYAVVRPVNSHHHTAVGSFPLSSVNSVQVEGLSGNDVFRLQDSPLGVTVQGGNGNDHVTGSQFADTIYGHAGDDIVLPGSGDNMIYGGPGQDQLWGSSGDDLIAGGDDHDEIWGVDGENSIYGGAGNDIIQGGHGNDLIHGQEDLDTIYGNGGDDDLYGDDGDDFLYGGAGDDYIWGGNGKDKIRGQAGDDRLWGEAGNDVIWGLDEPTIGTAATEYNWLWGGDGDDIYAAFGGTVGVDNITDTAGWDTVFTEASDYPNFDLSGGFATFDGVTRHYMFAGIDDILIFT